jgi:hypothetical protein
MTSRGSSGGSRSQKRAGGGEQMLRAEHLRRGEQTAAYALPLQFTDAADQKCVGCFGVLVQCTLESAHVQRLVHADKLSDLKKLVTVGVHQLTDVVTA